MQISQKRAFQIVFIREVHSSSKRDQLEEAPRPFVHAHDWWHVATWNPTNMDASWHFALKGSTPCVKMWPWYQKSGCVLHPRVWHSATKDPPCDSVNTVEIFATDWGFQTSQVSELLPPKNQREEKLHLNLEKEILGKSSPSNQEEKTPTRASEQYLAFCETHSCLEFLDI